MKAALWPVLPLGLGALVLAAFFRLPLASIKPPASAVLAALGATASFSGGILLWVYGIPNRINRDGHSYLILQQPDEEMKKRSRFYDRMSSLGLFLLITGFVIQLFDILRPR
jgi:hypothetical protein